ncbi:MAG: 50S ribosomal protein L15e [Candidatus Aenigmatarchaeota archaeon]
MSKHASALWKRPKESLGELWRQHLIAWRKEGTVTRIDRPTRPERARALGYKSKQGFVLARVRIKKGLRKRPKVAGGRRPKRAGRFFSTGKSKQAICEEKVARKFPGLEMLASYWVGEDGDKTWYEAILVDPAHPAVKKDRDVGWICEPQHTGRAHRGLTSAGKKYRGLRKKGLSSEKTRPSLRARKRRGK